MIRLYWIPCLSNLSFCLSFSALNNIDDITKLIDFPSSSSSSSSSPSSSADVVAVFVL